MNTETSLKSLPLTQQESLQHQGTSNSSLTTKLRVAFGVVLGLAVLAAVGVCAAVIVPHALTAGEDQQHYGDPSIDLETKAKLLDLNKEVVNTHVAAIARMARSGNRRRLHEPKNCISFLTNESYPAAHIAGKGNKWYPTPEPTAPSSSGETYDDYQTKWICKPAQNHYAYVDGGMNFTQADKKLRVPLCGYYYVSSQIYFQVDYSTPSDTPYGYHQLVVERNCTGLSSRVSLQSHSTIGPVFKEARFSTFIGDVVKMCTGDTIKVDIPSTSPCCPRGENSFIAAHLIAETTCDWPPNILEE